jgi:hypothetical protein
MNEGGLARVIAGPENRIVGFRRDDQFLVFFPFGDVCLTYSVHASTYLMFSAPTPFEGRW